MSCEPRPNSLPSRISALERPRHAGDADGVRVTAQHQRPAALSALEHADDVRPAWRDVGDLDGESPCAKLVGQSTGDIRLTPRAWNERGIDRIDRDKVAKQRDRRIGDWDMREASNLNRPMNPEARSPNPSP